MGGPGHENDQSAHGFGFIGRARGWARPYGEVGVGAAPLLCPIIDGLAVVGVAGITVFKDGCPAATATVAGWISGADGAGVTGLGCIRRARAASMFRSSFPKMFLT